MTYAFDIPGYLQGHRFSDDPLYYDAAAQRFKDLAGYDHLGNGLTIDTGAPVFETLNSNRGLRLNGTFAGKFQMAIPWMGSAIFVIKPIYASGATLTRYPLIFGDSASTPANASLTVAHASGVRKVGLATGSNQLATTQNRNDNNLVALVMCFDQQTRKAYSTPDCVTITETTAPASTTNGIAVALGAGQYGVRFGNMSGVAGNVTEITDVYAHMYEQHYFDGNILTGSLAKTKEFVDRLKAQYGVA